MAEHHDISQADVKFLAVSEESSDDDRTKNPSSDVSLGRRIVGWTNNLIATSIVVILAIVGGSQLVMLWGANESSPAPKQSDVLASWPQLESCSIEFGNRTCRLQRRSVEGDREEVHEVLRQQCRSALEQSPVPVGELGKAETVMLRDSMGWSPIEQESGHWRLFRNGHESGGLGMPTVFGIRDNCDGENESRLVVWGIALSQGPSQWITFIFHPATKTEAVAHSSSEWPLPNSAHRTLAISDEDGGTLIGFAGGDPTDAMRFFDHFAGNNDWDTSKKWQQIGGTWHASYVSRTKIETSRMSIQLTVDHEQLLRGMLIVEPTASL